MAPGSMPAAKSSALKKCRDCRRDADRGKGNDLFKRTPCMVESYPTIYGSKDSACRVGSLPATPGKVASASFEAPPIVAEEESNAGDTGGACRQAVRGVGAVHTAQGKDGNTLSRRASPAQCIEPLRYGHWWM
jgi:hypothetical protein